LGKNFEIATVHLLPNPFPFSVPDQLPTSFDPT
jgi:hypothetical protein